jgi:hypothetical protein
MALMRGPLISAAVNIVFSARRQMNGSGVIILLSANFLTNRGDA